MAVQSTVAEEQKPKLENGPSEIELTTIDPANAQDQKLGETLVNGEDGNTELTEKDVELVGATHQSDRVDENSAKTDQDTRNRNANRSGNNNKNERNTSSSSNSESSAESESHNQNDGSSQIPINISNNSNSRATDADNKNASADQESNM